MRRFYTLVALATMVLCAPQMQAQETIHALATVSKYGDSMGQTPENLCTKQTHYLYDKNGHLSRQLEMFHNAEEDPWTLCYYYCKKYDANGNLAQTYSMQYGMHDQSYLAFQADNDTVDYEYNEKGQLVKEYQHYSKNYYTYEYDESGNLVKKVYQKYYQGTYVPQTFTYSDFTVGGPQKVKSESTSSYNCYDGVITYDEAGHKLSEVHYDSNGNLTGMPEYWTYDETGFCTTYEKMGLDKGKEINSAKTEYIKLEGCDGYRSKSYTYTLDGTWAAKGGSTTDYVKKDFHPSYAATLKNVDVVTEKSLANLTIDVPTTLEGKAASIAVYRNGLLVATLNDVKPGELTYTEENVQNGTWDYFVETLVDGEEEAVSNVMQITTNRVFPHASNVKVIGAAIDANGCYQVSLSWTNPEITDDMHFVNTDIMKIGTYYTTSFFNDGDEITSPTQTTATVNFRIDPVQTLYVQTRYQCGKASSDTITVDATKYIGKVSSENKKLTVIETYGDVLGDEETDLPTKKQVTFYGKDNRVQREATYGKTLGKDEYTITNYYTYVYNEAGMLEKKYSNQYGRYDYGDLGFRESTDTTTYKYDMEGYLLSETDCYGVVTEYEYADNGSLVKKTITDDANGHQQIITYNDFAGKDKPRLTVSEGDLSSYNWKLETTYNDNGDKATERKSTYSNYDQAYKPSTFEQWVYNESGDLASDTVFSIKVVNDVEEYSYKSYTSYEPEEANPNRVKVVKYVWDNILMKMNAQKNWYVYVYSDINATKYAPTLTVTSDTEKLNTVALKVDIPTDKQTTMTAFNIYRNGIEIGHALKWMDDRYYITDDYGNNGEWLFTDERVVNGTYDYFVEYATLDNTMTKEASTNNISNIVNYTFDAALPTATNLRETSRSQTSSYNSEEETTEQNIFVTLEWDAPQNVEGLGFKRYNLMVTTMQIAENEDEDGQNTSYELELRGRESVEAYVQCVYELGRANSDTIVINETSDGIIKIGDEQLKITIDGQVYNLAGQPVGDNYKGIVITRQKKYIRK